MSSSILYEVKKAAADAHDREVRHYQDMVKELKIVQDYAHLAELYPETREYFDVLCLHLNALRRLANDKQLHKRIEATLQKVRRIQADRQSHAA
jgi:hypothetical protein